MFSKFVSFLTGLFAKFTTKPADPPVNIEVKVNVDTTPDQPVSQPAPKVKVQTTKKKPVSKAPADPVVKLPANKKKPGPKPKQPK